MSYAFFSLISRMKYINRWGLMRNSLTENIQEHSHMTAVIAHALAVIRRDIYGKDCNPDYAASLALYHDASEIITGDLPTPIKYNNEDIMSAYKKVERLASKRLLSLLPLEIQASYEPLLDFAEDDELYPLLKAADKFSAYIKCIEERKAGNAEFLQAEEQTLQSLQSSPLPEVQYFIENFIPAFELTLDETGKIEDKGVKE